MNFDPNIAAGPSTSSLLIASASSSLSYSVIGGGAAPFNTAWDFSSLGANRRTPVVTMNHPPLNPASSWSTFLNGGDDLLAGCMKQVRRLKRRHEQAALRRANRNNNNRVETRTTKADSRTAAPNIPRGERGGKTGSTNLNLNSYNNFSDRSGKLYCRTGFHLQIHPNGRVNGTRQENSRFGKRLVSLQYLLFMCPIVSYQLMHTSDCIFTEQMLENYYNTYTSCKYARGKRRWFVALNKRGKARRGNRSKKKQKFSQFLVLHLDQGGKRRHHHHHHYHHHHHQHNRNTLASSLSSTIKNFATSLNSNDNSDKTFIVGQTSANKLKNTNNFPQNSKHHEYLIKLWKRRRARGSSGNNVVQHHQSPLPKNNILMTSSNSIIATNYGWLMANSNNNKHEKGRSIGTAA